MSNLTGRSRALYVQKMFGRIAPKYDLLNRLMTGGQDIRWRKIVIERLSPEPDARYLDIGAGTGDLAYAILSKEPHAEVVAADFTLEMMRIGRLRPFRERIHWVVADAENLPFNGSIFSGVVSGFLLRNVSDAQKAVGEQVRVLEAGGKVVSLDTTPPKSGVLRPFIWVHLHIVIPLLGKLIAGSTDAYTYLPETTEKFLTAEKLAQLIEKSGLSSVGFVRKMFGTVAIHWGTKPGDLPQPPA
ncbi:MAG: ubiquinone/menaquinone biosynthesis methyltransferase [Anaerolineae bacterium]|nr:ubiquinone/menaquinone biosynthesis methyltransferase [Anaerolineae bacterium]